MADRVLFISWGENIAGREERGLEVFNEAVGMYGRAQQEGRIEAFNVVLLTPNGGMDGYMEVRGSAEQITALRNEPEFLRNMMDASLIVHDFKMTEGYTGNGVAEMMAIYQQAIAAVPQPA